VSDRLAGRRNPLKVKNEEWKKRIKGYKRHQGKEVTAMLFIKTRRERPVENS